MNEFRHLTFFPIIKITFIQIRQKFQKNLTIFRLNIKLKLLFLVKCLILDI